MVILLSLVFVIVERMAKLMSIQLAIISHTKVPEFRDSWLQDKNEIINIFLARGVSICQCAVVDEHQIVILCHSLSLVPEEFVWSFPSSGCLQLKSPVKLTWSLFSHNPSIP